MKLLRISFALTLICILAPSANAQRAVTAGIGGVSDQQEVEGTVPLVAEGSSAAGIRRLTMWIDGDVVAEVTPNSLRQRVEATFDWDTTRYVTSEQLARNRTYDVKVRAVSNSGAEDEAVTKVVVDNAPSQPTGLAARVKGNSIELHWAPNPEPDIVGYRVERFYGDAYEKAGEVRASGFSQQKDPGRYSYRVVAIRSSEVDPQGLESDPSASVTATVARSAGSSLEHGSRGGSAESRRAAGTGRSVAIGTGGLPSGAALPQRPGLSGLPDAPAAIPWGSYEKKLPYRLPKGGVPIEAAPARSEAGAWEVIPPDGLRWVALGLLLIVSAGLARFLAWRLEPAVGAAKIDA